MKVGTWLGLALLFPSAPAAQTVVAVEAGRGWLHGWHHGTGHGFTASLEHRVLPLTALDLDCGNLDFEYFRPFRHCSAGVRHYLFKGPVTPVIRIGYGGSATESSLSGRLDLGGGLRALPNGQTSLELRYSRVEVYTPALHPRFSWLALRAGVRF